LAMNRTTICGRVCTLESSSHKQSIAAKAVFH
jgi:hypothetical protein